MLDPAPVQTKGTFVLAINPHWVASLLPRVSMSDNTHNCPDGAEPKHAQGLFGWTGEGSGLVCMHVNVTIWHSLEV